MRRDSRAWIEVDRQALKDNIRSITHYVGGSAGVMAVVKADAYGHGLKQTARAAVSAGCSWLGVAAVQEGVQLRHSGILAPIAVLTPFCAADAGEVAAHRLTPLVGDGESIRALAQAQDSQNPVRVHLDIDSGIGRSGVLPEHAVNLWRQAESCDLLVEGLSTHYADADSTCADYTRLQQARFKGAMDSLRSAGAMFRWIHLDSSASILKYREMECNLVRAGLLMYGIVPASADGSKIGISPALSLKTRIASVRRLPAGRGISYGVTHRLLRDSLIATALIGYGDGYPRELSNAGHMLVRGMPAPILGRVCMDQTVIDITDIPGAASGDEVVCIGRQLTQCIRVEQIAALTGAAMHEITTSLTSRLPRIYL